MTFSKTLKAAIAAPIIAMGIASTLVASQASAGYYWPYSYKSYNNYSYSPGYNAYGNFNGYRPGANFYKPYSYGGSLASYSPYTGYSERTPYGSYYSNNYYSHGYRYVY